MGIDDRRAARSEAVDQCLGERLETTREAEYEVIVAGGVAAGGSDGFAEADGALTSRDACLARAAAEAKLLQSVP